MFSVRIFIFFYVYKVSKKQKAKYSTGQNVIIKIIDYFTWLHSKTTMGV